MDSHNYKKRNVSQPSLRAFFISSKKPKPSKSNENLEENTEQSSSVTDLQSTLSMRPNIILDGPGLDDKKTSPPCFVDGDKELHSIQLGESGSPSLCCRSHDDKKRNRLPSSEPSGSGAKKEGIPKLCSSPSPSSSYAADTVAESIGYDVGEYIGKQVSDYTKYQLLENPWRPSPTYKLPYSIQMKNNKETKRYLGHNHLNSYSWLVYSPSMKGLFCKYCPWFVVGGIAGGRGGEKNMRLQSLVTKPLVSFKDLVGQNGSLQSHENHVYHKRAVQAAENFIKCYHDPNHDVANQLDKKRVAEVEDNRNRLKPIIETVIFLGRQNIPFRGHRDDGEVLKTQFPSQLPVPVGEDHHEDIYSSDIANEGNFRELIRFRVRCGDSILESHLRNTSSRATYISKTSQNEFIKLCGEQIRQQIISRVTEAGIYSLLFDETTDVSGKSQISLSLRYVSDGFVREDFICFVDAFEELTMEQKQKEVSRKSNSKKDYLNIRDSDDDNSEKEEEENERKPAKKDFEKAYTERASQEDGFLAELVSDTEEFESIRREILQLRRRRVKHVRDEDEDQGLRKLSSDNSEETELSLSGVALGRLVRSKIRRYKLDPTRCVGIGCDSCAVNISDAVGAVREIQLEAVNAQKVPCYSHKLNNSLSLTSKVKEVNCAIGIMKEVVSFFSSHPKRLAVLLKHLGAPLKSLCETRWVDRHDGVLQFLQDLPSICEVLEEIAGWRDSLTAGKASSLASSLQEPKFVVTLVCLSDLLCLTLILSRTLQKKNTDLMQASKEVASLISVLTRRREEAENEFSALWKKASRTAAALDIALTIPRRSVRQTMRANYETESPEIYYRLAIYIPILDHFLTDIRRRFPQSVLDVFHLPALVPDCLLNLSSKDLEMSTELIFKQFQNILEAMGVEVSTGLPVLKAEIIMWKEKWASIKKSNPQNAVPSTAVEALYHCSENVYSVVHPLLKILATLPVSNATPERTFSSLRRLKTWLRATMGQERLTGLALLNTHRDINVDVDKVIDQFAKSGNRRIPFIL